LRKRKCGKGKFQIKEFENFQITNMKLTEVLVKPILTEKANAQQDKLRRYAFKVGRKANKLEIKKAIEEFYGVTVVNVNTAVVPGKNKTRYTKAGFVKGQKPAYKKAHVTVAEGETIDLYGNI
jgi:large subunit ribosomal protein L23